MQLHCQFSTIHFTELVPWQLLHLFQIHSGWTKSLKYKTFEISDWQVLQKYICKLCCNFGTKKKIQKMLLCGCSRQPNKACPQGGKSALDKGIHHKTVNVIIMTSLPLCCVYLLFHSSSIVIKLFAFSCFPVLLLYTGFHSHTDLSQGST